MYAGNKITSGDNNVIIGYDADVSVNSASNQIVIGANATGQGDTYAVIGDENITRLYAAQDAGATLYAAGLNLGGTAVSSTAAELNLLDGVTSTTAELNILDGVTSTAAELNILDGATSTATEINLLDGGTSVGSSVTVADADGVILNDGGTMKLIPASDFTSYIQSGTSLDDLSDAKSEGTGFTGSLLIGHQTTGSLNNAMENTAVGLTALDALTTGDYNVALGHGSLGATTTGYANTATGAEALLANTTGYNNTASGWRAL